MIVGVDGPIAEGETVAVRSSETGLSVGPFREQPATGKTYEIKVVQWLESRAARTSPVQWRDGPRDDQPPIGVYRSLQTTSTGPALAERFSRPRELI